MSASKDDARINCESLSAIADDLLNQKEKARASYHALEARAFDARLAAVAAWAKYHKDSES